MCKKFFGKVISNENRAEKNFLGKKNFLKTSALLMFAFFNFFGKKLSENTWLWNQTQKISFAKKNLVAMLQTKLTC